MIDNQWQLFFQLCGDKNRTLQFLFFNCSDWEKSLVKNECIKLIDWWKWFIQWRVRDWIFYKYICIVPFSFVILSIFDSLINWNHYFLFKKCASLFPFQILRRNLWSRFSASKNDGDACYTMKKWFHQVSFNAQHNFICVWYFFFFNTHRRMVN